MKSDPLASGARPVSASAAAEQRAWLLGKRSIEPDKFQLKAFDAIDRGHSVLVAAPTSSGKTLVAEYAAALCLAQGKRVAYTSPIKALSNQKLRDLRALQSSQVGLLTGDNVIAPAAPTLVMTTEVLRNMIYSGTQELNEFGVVVLDEVHYLQDPYRGPVWEEVIIGLPPGVQLVCLSATATNADELAQWITSVREQTCEVVVETERPVELREHFLIFDKTNRHLHDFPTLRGHHPNSEVQRFLQQSQRGRRPNTRGSGARSSGAKGSGARGSGAKGGTHAVRPNRLEVLSHLAQNDRLPVIMFVFSRQGCEDAVNNCLEHGLNLTDPVSQQQIVQIANEHVADISAADLRSLHYDQWLEGLKCGVAAHHAGMVPPFKEVVEDCFAAGLLGAVFATETLALGLNMPARSVVVEQLSRFKGEGFVMLTPGEYTQLTGRAGRRGIDEIGHAYTLWSPYDSFEQTAELVASADFEIASAFRPTYNMAANLIRTCVNREAAVELLSKSFAQFQAGARVPEWSAELTVRKEELKQSRRLVRQLSGGAKKTNNKPGTRHHGNRGNHGNRESRALTSARREFDQCESRVNLLKNRIALAHGGLAKTFDLVSQMLAQVGSIDGWQLTDSGQQLSRIFHECDLVVVLALRAGLFDGLDPASLAGLVSCISYEHHSRDDPPPPSIPTPALRQAAYAIERISAQINERERDLGLTETRPANVAFFECAYAWASGAALEQVLGNDARPARASGRPARGRHTRGGAPPSNPVPDNSAAGQSTKLGPYLTPGDFVRQIRNLADLLRQIMFVAHKSDTRNTARAAVAALDRGVVAAAIGIEPSDSEPDEAEPGTTGPGDTELGSNEPGATEPTR